MLEPCPRLIGPLNVMNPFTPFYTSNVHRLHKPSEAPSHHPPAIDGQPVPWMTIPPSPPPGPTPAPRSRARVVTVSGPAHQTWSLQRPMQHPVTLQAAAGRPSGGGSACFAVWYGMCAGEHRTTGVTGSMHGITAWCQLPCICISPSVYLTARRWID